MAIKIIQVEPPKAQKPAAESKEPAKFDRNAYQREYMRKWRARQRSKIEGEKPSRNPTSDPQSP